MKTYLLAAVSLGVAVLTGCDGESAVPSSDTAATSAFVPGLAIDPAAPGRLFASTDRSVYRTVTGGE